LEQAVYFSVAKWTDVFYIAALWMKCFRIFFRYMFNKLHALLREWQNLIK
jgi:hypothetical protein